MAMQHTTAATIIAQGCRDYTEVDCDQNVLWFNEHIPSDKEISTNLLVNH